MPISEPVMLLNFQSAAPAGAGAISEILKTLITWARIEPQRPKNMQNAPLAPRYRVVVSKPRNSLYLGYLGS